MREKRKSKHYFSNFITSGTYQGILLQNELIPRYIYNGLLNKKRENIQCSTLLIY